MDINWEAITSISTAFLTLFTLGLMVATFWLAIIALQAKNSWKNELKEKKKLDLIREMKIKLTILTSYTVNVSPMIQCMALIKKEEFKSFNNDTFIKTELDTIAMSVGRLGVIKQELDYLKCFNISNKLKSLLDIIKMPPYNPLNLNMIEKEEEYIINLNKNKDKIRSSSKEIQELCDKEIDNFYNN